MDQIDFFVSYSHEDKEIVKGIVASLESAGAKCWFAPRDVVGMYAKAIVDAIGNAKIFLLCLSKNAATSEHVLNEVEMAYKKRKSQQNNLLIEPLCLEELDIDAPELDEIMYYIQRINFINPADMKSAMTIAQEIIIKNKDILKLKHGNDKKERTKSAYFTSQRETDRLAQQTKLLRKFDGDIYHKVFNEYQKPDILDVGCGNGSMIFDRLNGYCQAFRLIGVERDETKVKEAFSKFGSPCVSFIETDVEGSEFIDRLTEKMHEMGIEGFDIINISMLLLHLKSDCSLLRKLRRLLKSDGTIIIEDIDDGINYAYPDEGNMFERIYRICDNNETSGERRNGRQIYTNLHRAGFRKIELKKSGFTTIGLNYEEKETFWDIYFKFIYGDIHWMQEKYPANADIAEDCNWYTENYEDIFEAFMKDDFIFSLGFQIYAAKK